MLEGKTRIPPVDIEMRPDDLRETLEEQRKLWGAPLYPYLFYARNPAYFRAATAMWAALQEDAKRVPGTLRALLNRRVALVERLRILPGRPCCQRQQARHFDREDRGAQRPREQPAVRRRGEGGARIRRRDYGHTPRRRRRVVRAPATVLRRRHDRGADDDHRVAERVLALQPGVPHPIARVLEAMTGRAETIGSTKPLAYNDAGDKHQLRLILDTSIVNATPENIAKD
jgi:hypothetical protein